MPPIPNSPTIFLGPSGDQTGVTDYNQFAVACAEIKAAGSGTIQLGGGTYWISQTPQVPTGTTIAGAGIGITTIKAANNFAALQIGSNPGMVMFATVGNAAASNIRMATLTLDGNEQNIPSIPGYATAVECSPVGFANVTGLTIDRISVINAIGYSIFPVSCTDVQITGCRVITGQTSSGYTNQDAIHVTDCTAVRISGNYIDTGTISGVGDDGIAVQGISTGCADVAITGNVIEHGAAHGITLVLGGATVSNVAITGNVIRNCINEGMLLPFYTTFVSSGTYLLTDVSVTGNVFKSVATNGTASGITLQDAFGGTGGHVGTAGYAGVSIAGNVFDTCTTTGFGIYAQAGSDLTISDNTFRNWGSVRGIDIGDNSSSTSRTVSNAQVTGNTVDMSSTAQSSPAGIVVVDSPDVVVADNTVIGPGTGVAGGIGISLLSITTAIIGAVVDCNRSKAWATGISETNNGVAPNFNAVVGNNTHGCTAFVSTVGASDVVASNVVT